MPFTGQQGHAGMSGSYEVDKVKEAGEEFIWPTASGEQCFVDSA